MGFEYVVVSHSDHFGAVATPSWGDPVSATTATSAADFNDKNWIGVDDNPASPYFGRVYVSWTEFRSATATGYGNEPVMVATSIDGGNTFGSPTQLSPAGNDGTGDGRQGSSVAPGPDGTVYVAFEQGPSQVVSVSLDGGKRWSRPTAIGPVKDIADPLPGANFRTSSFVVIDMDQNSGTVYATWVTDLAGHAQLVVTSSKIDTYAATAPTGAGTATPVSIRHSANRPTSRRHPLTAHRNSATRTATWRRTVRPIRSPGLPTDTAVRTH